jgi:glucose/arabinose dehydrogenase
MLVRSGASGGVGFPGVLGRAIRLAILIGLLVPASASAGITATVVGTFAAPTYIAAPPGDTHRLFVVQQSGQIELIKDGGTPATFLDISREVTYNGGEQGLLSMAFAPDYATSGRFYVYYTSKHCPNSPGCDERVSEFTAEPSGETANAGSERVLITIPHPDQSNHNGGQLQFGPDGDLYVSVGDGGGENDTEQNAQHLGTLLGKILRISPQTDGYSIPAGNPFSGGPECANGPSSGPADCPEIWAYGLRNPWRFSFDSATGDMAIADVGQASEEELDFAPSGQNAGANYGWPCYEGLELDALAPASECTPLPSPVVFPVLTYPHPRNCEGAPFCGDGIIGGYVMHDPALPSLDGCYVYGDLGTPGLRIVHLAQPSASAPVALGPEIGGLSTFGLDASGHLYAADIVNGDVYRIESDGNPASDPRCAPPTPPSSPSPSPSASPSLPPPLALSQHAPVNTSAPAIHGSPTPGATLTCTSGGWSGATSFAYEWLRDAARLAAGATYRPRASDLGQQLSCQVTASNAAGSALAVSATVRVSRPAPRLSELRITPTAFLAATSALSHRRKGGGGTVAFRLDESATVMFSVQRGGSGREVSGRCRRDTRPPSGARRCTIWSAVSGSFRVTGRRGTNRLTFNGRIGGHELDPGQYRLVAEARDAAGSSGQLLSARFSILSR